jgi:hypothetical protein
MNFDTRRRNVGSISRHLVAVILAIVTIACGSPPESPGTAASASASALPSATVTSTASPAASTTATATATATATTKPNPTAGPGVYTSLSYGYRVELPAGWRRSACQSTKGPSQPPAIETFTNATVEAETGTDTGPEHDVVVVRVEDNSSGQTALGWLESGKMGSSMGSRFEKITFDNNPDAARIVTTDSGALLAIVVNARFRIYALSVGMRAPTPGSDAPARALMTSLHILRDNELAEARATLATPPPPPVRSAEEVADAVARGFAQKDTSVLASVADDCLTQALESAGAGFSSQTKFLATLRTGFANGLAVTVQPRPLEDQMATSANVRGTWQEPGQARRNVKMMLQKHGSTWVWIGVLYLQG